MQGCHYIAIFTINIHVKKKNIKVLCIFCLQVNLVAFTQVI